MDLPKMLEKCEREQWQVGDLDWSGRPRDMSEKDEIAIVQYFTDMAGIERLAAALFDRQRQNAKDPTLKKIFASFVRDEIRHSHAAQMLADFYDVRRLETYQPNPSLVKFTPHFVNAVKFLSPEIANAYITSGELILDVALLRSINDHVRDEMSSKAMELINRDESRHIAVDFAMVEHYTSDEYLREKRTLKRKVALRDRAKGAVAMAGVLYHAAPFFRSVFFEPMRIIDPTGRRLREAMKRIQLLANRSGVRSHPLTRFMTALQDLYNDHPTARLVFGRLIERVVGVEGSLLERLYTGTDLERATRMSYDELAKEALAAKYAA